MIKEFHSEIIKTEIKNINRTVLYKYFGYRIPSVMLSDLFNNDGEENTGLVTLIQKNLNYLAKDYNNTPD